MKDLTTTDIVICAIATVVTLGAVVSGLSSILTFWP